ncbi:MAG: transcriptional repressor LexA [Magnetococcales bacterium]|nr:transcriptional repressor LexA [Magnetococcales bacterium]
MAQERQKKRGRKPVAGITPVLKKTLHLIQNLTVQEGHAPTVMELADRLGISGPSVHEQLRNLERKGYIRRRAHKARSIEVLKGGATLLPRLIPVPILGEVTAGTPILAEENYVGEVLVETSVARGRCFALSVLGDSMIEAGIVDGDIVIVRQQPIAESGEIVVALLEDEATVKRLSIDGERITLQPANPDYAPIVVQQEDALRILGKVIAVRSRTPPGKERAS